MSDTRVRDFYDTEEEFNEVLEAAEENAISRDEMQFVDSLSMKVKEWGASTFLSEGQNEWLRRIAKVD